MSSASLHLSKITPNCSWVGWADERHAVIESQQRQYICIRDKSKFGVSIDDVDESYREKISHSTQASQKSVHQIQKDMDVPLTQGCSITVGVNNSRLRLEWEELIVSHSLLNKDQIASLNTSCASIGIQVSKSWSERVKLLVMHQIQMTPKLLLALIDQKDIVTPDFMTAIRNRNELKDLIPDPASCCALYEPIGEEPQQRTRWRHRITGVIQDQEPPVHQMGENYIFRPEFVEGFPDEYKAYVMPNARSKGEDTLACVRAIANLSKPHNPLI